MFVVRFGRTLKNNPKKSIAGALVLAWAGNWAEKKYQAHLFRRAECQTAVKLGRETLNQFDNPKKATVFLNPAASNGKAGQMYEKYAAPILHLAGFNVHLVKLAYEGEAKRLMSVIADTDTDMIICAGGDGTLSEIITGLLRRPDDNWKKIPIGVIPLGKMNAMCRRLLPDADFEKQPHFISSAASACTKNVTTRADVMKIDGSEGKTVYAVSSIRWGTYCDLQEKAKKMWYFGGLKYYVPFLFSFSKQNPQKPRDFSLAYTDPDVAPVIEEEISKIVTTPTISGMSILSNFLARLWPWGGGTASTDVVDSEKEGIAKEIACEPEWHELPKRSIEFFAEANTHLNDNKRDKAYIKLTFESENVTSSEFITKGPYTVHNVVHTPVDVASDVEVDSFTLSSPLDEDDKQKISIDNDRYEAMDITVKLLPNCIKMIHSPQV